MKVPISVRSRYSLLLFYILFLLNSCTNDKKDLAVIRHVIDEYKSENLRLIDNAARAVEDAGNREKDVKFLEEVKVIHELRASYGLPSYQSPNSTIPKQENLLSYAWALDSLHTKKGHTMSKKYDQFREALINGEISDELDSLLTFLNLFVLEKEYLEYLSQEIVSGCGYSRGPVLVTPCKDTLVLGTSHRFILNGFQIFDEGLEQKIEDLRIENSSDPDELSIEQIGSSVLFDFKPSHAGTFTLTGILKVNSKLTEYSYEEPIAVKFVVQ